MNATPAERFAKGKIYTLAGECDALRAKVDQAARLLASLEGRPPPGPRKVDIEVPLSRSRDIDFRVAPTMLKALYAARDVLVTELKLLYVQISVHSAVHIIIANKYGTTFLERVGTGGRYA